MVLKSLFHEGTSLSGGYFVIGKYDVSPANPPA